LYSKYSGHNFYITYGYGFDNCAGSSPTTITLNFLDGCVTQRDDQGHITGGATYTFTATGVNLKEYTDSACQGQPYRNDSPSYDTIGFKQCNPNEDDEDAKSTIDTTKFLMVPTQNPTRAPTYAPGKPTPKPTASPTLQKFPFLLQENFLSTDCSGTAKVVHVDVTGVCDISYSWTKAPNANDPNHYDKTLNPGSYMRFAEGESRYRQQFSDDKCKMPIGSKSNDGPPLGQCYQSGDPSGQSKSVKYTGITNLSDLVKKYPGYLVYSDYLGNDCSGDLVGVTFQDSTKTCYPNNMGGTAGVAFSRTTCDANSFYSEMYSDGGCTMQVAKYPYQPGCRNKSPEEISSSAKSTKNTCNLLPGPPTKSPTIAPTFKPTTLPTIAQTRAPTIAQTRAPTIAQTRAPTIAQTKAPVPAVATKAPVKTPTK